jgi:ribosomal protein S27AE
MKTASVAHNFNCPKFECRAEYFAIRRDYAPDERPRCSKCGTPLMAMEKGQYVHYQACGTTIKSDDGP